MKEKKPRGGHNKGRRFQAKAFTEEEVKAIQKELLKRGNLQELVLFYVSLDTMLRSSDLLALKVEDVLTLQGRVRENFTVRQQKTKRDVMVSLSQTTLQAIENLLAQASKTRQDYLFSIQVGKPISAEWFRILVKRWASSIGLDPGDYSGHSTRRTQAVHLYNQGMDIAKISKALGHSSLLATILYLGIEERDVIEALRKYKLKL